MPELPEVESIRNALRFGRGDDPPVLGNTISRARVLWDRTLADPDVATFEHLLPGQTIQDIGRRGKFLIFHLSNNYLLFHLRMSGDMRVESADSPIAPHHRILIDFTNQMRLAFNDTRKFGRAWLVLDPKEVTGRLGPEPLDPDLTEEDFNRRLVERRRQLKPLLMDQSFLAGLGNIYTDEALHLARLHPLRLASSLSPAEASRLYTSIRSVLEEGIRRQGASIDWVYRGGDFQRFFRAYQRTGLPCPGCGAPIEKITVGQRSTHFCPNCQKLY